MNSIEKYILLAEDDSFVAELVMHALSKHPTAPKIIHVKDGVETLDFLHGRGSFSRRPASNPAVVLLDVKMPRLDGIEVLRQVKGDERLRTIPIVMLTSSHDERDVSESYRLGVNAYVVKPVEFRRFAMVLEHLEAFWMHINHPPPETRSLPLAAGGE